MGERVRQRERERVGGSAETILNLSRSFLKNLFKGRILRGHVKVKNWILKKKKFGV